MWRETELGPGGEERVDGRVAELLDRQGGMTAGGLFGSVIVDEVLAFEVDIMFPCVGINGYADARAPVPGRDQSREPQSTSGRVSFRRIVDPIPTAACFGLDDHPSLLA